MHIMEIIFNKEGEKFAAEFKVDADFNLHIERPGAGSISFFQKTSYFGEYAHIDNMGNQNYNVVFDADFTAMVWPKYIKVISEVMPTSAIVTTKGNVDNSGGNGGSGNGGSSIIHILSEQKDVEEYIPEDDYYANYDLYVDVKFDLDTRAIVSDNSYKLTYEGGEDGETYYKEYITVCGYDSTADKLSFIKGNADGYTISMFPNRDIEVLSFDYVEAGVVKTICPKGELTTLSVELNQLEVDRMAIVRNWDE